MWQRLSLRARLLLPVVPMVVVALALGGVALQIVSPEQFEYENAQGSHSAKAVADALNAALAVSSNPQATLDAFAASLGGSDAVNYRRAGPTRAAPQVRVSSPTVPRWFVALLDIPDIGAAYPVMIGSDHVGDIFFEPDLSADVFEKWVGFLAIVLSGSVLVLLAALSAYFITGSAIRPLEQLATGLTRMGQGDYDTPVPLAGPAEIRKSGEEANRLARTLKGLSQRNRELLLKLMSVQDDERRELARELHDELGPLLFAIRANATALSEQDEGDEMDRAASAEHILQAAETLHQANRRILEGLSPLHVRELGLVQSIQTLLRNARLQAPTLKLAANIDDGLNGIDGVLSQTIYRVVQESLTNALRHAQAARIDVDAGIVGEEIDIKISDDGRGPPADTAFGRGLTGMRERIRALGGHFELRRDESRTLVHCRLPLEPAAVD